MFSIALSSDPQDPAPTRPVTAAAARAFLYDRIDYERIRPATTARFDLRRMRRLVRHLGYGDWLAPVADDKSFEIDVRRIPDDDLRPAVRDDETRRARPLIIHIAGTKGKGSTATMTSALLTAAGYRVGLYTSPHLTHINERFRIDGHPCGDDDLITLTSRLHDAVSDWPERLDPPTFFELTTAGAVDHFARCGCDAVVLEVGLGGRLDSTNVYQTDLTAITPIGLDHQHLLGNTHREIAREKAGILKRRVPVFTSARGADAVEVIEHVASDLECPLAKIDHDFHIRCTPRTDWGSQLVYRRGTFEIRSELSLEGSHQADNAALAITLATEAEVRLARTEPVRTEPVRSDDGQPSSGEIETVDRRDVASVAGEVFAAVRHPARIERFKLDRDITVVVDAAHNEDSISVLTDVVRRRGPRHVSVVVATSVDKDPAAILRPLCRIARSITLTRYGGNPRRADPSDLRRHVPSSYRGTLSVDEDCVDATRRAIEAAPDGGWVVVCGSFFLAAEVLPTIRDRALG